MQTVALSPAVVVTAPQSCAVANQLVAESYGDWDTSITRHIGGTYLTPLSDGTSSSSDSSTWDSTTYIDPSFLIRTPRHNDVGPWYTKTIDCGCPKPHIRVRTRGLDPFNRGEFKVISFGPSVGGTDPYVNNLRLEIVCTLAAVAALGTYMGLSQEMICAEESQSAFFRPGAEAADRAATVQTIQKVYKTLKPDLRPTREQITVEHHPYIDILPFPTLRKNLIAHQKDIDEDEFFEDMVAGLVCWGGAGLGQKDRNEGTVYAPTGTPWDVRSWEAKAWFVKKYWTLLGGEDGELVRQSEWWREIRGEESLEPGV